MGVGMWDFDSQKEFVLIHNFEIPAIYTWGDKDKDKRESIRRSAIRNFVRKRKSDFQWYGFRIKIKRNAAGRELDIENVPKLILDAFSSKQIDQDNSTYKDIPGLRLYPDDTLQYIRAIQIEGEFTKEEGDITQVWIFGKRPKG